MPSTRYQKKALRKALKRGNGAFFFDPGLGKTKTAIDFVGIKHQQGEVNRVLIVCPVSALGVWPEELNKHLPLKYNIIQITGYKHSKATVAYLDGKALTFLVTTFDVVKSIYKDIVKWNPNCIIADESHYLKHHTSKRSTVMHRLGDRLDRNKIIMSGTPISKSPLGIYSQYRFLDKTVFGTRWPDFENKYAIKGGYMGHKVIGIRNPKKLAKRIKRLATRARKGIHDKDLPSKTWQVVPFDLSPKAKRIYNKMAKEAVVQFKSGRISTAEVGATKLIRFQQITGGFLKDEDGNYIKVADDKLLILDDLLNSLSGNKVVIFARFKREIKKIKSLCKARGLNPLVIKGGVSSKKREERRLKFRDDDFHQALICQIGAAQSIDLTASNIAIYFSMDFVVENFIQSQDRIHRKNQKHSCTYYVLQANGTVDVSIYELLKRNIHISELILDRYKEIMEGRLKL